MRTVAINAIPTWPRPIAIPTVAVLQSLTEAVHKWSLLAAGQGSNEVAEPYTGKEVGPDWKN